MRLPTHRAEYTGNAGADRVQDNVRDLIARANALLVSIAKAHGIGVTRVTLTSTKYTLSISETNGAFLVFDGTPSATVTITVPRATDSTAYGRRVKNLTGQDLTFINRDGSTTLTSAAGEGRIIVSSEGPEVWA